MYVLYTIWPCGLGANPIISEMDLKENDFKKSKYCVYCVYCVIAERHKKRQKDKKTKRQKDKKDKDQKDSLILWSFGYISPVFWLADCFWADYFDEVFPYRMSWLFSMSFSPIECFDWLWADCFYWQPTGHCTALGRPYSALPRFLLFSRNIQLSRIQQLSRI